jgi:hypothetical protein
MRTKVTTDAVRLGVADTALCVVGVLAERLPMRTSEDGHR